MDNIINFKKLVYKLLDMIQEQQVKIGYMSGVTRFYYPLQSLNRLLGTELTEEEMQHALEEFSDHACDRLGKVSASSKTGRCCITLPPQASDYVHENRKPSEFLVRFIGTVARHGCTLDEVMNVFHSYSKHVHMEKTTGTGFDYLVYFEDGIPDDYRYCLSLEGEHMIYHKFTPEDYEDFGYRFLFCFLKNRWTADRLSSVNRRFFLFSTPGSSSASPVPYLFSKTETARPASEN